MHKPQTPLAMWGGMECTINRVGSAYFDQLKLSGHLQRIEQDIACLAGLGITTLRTCLHWERFDQLRSAGQDPWHYFDRTMRSLRAHHIQPIVGLIHHGSGPASTDLLDPDFPEKLAAYALEIAQRYPWVEAYTPVNEPNTTARFSCMYTHWYPHRRDAQSFARALVQQVKGIVLSMQAIRNVQPEAKLVTTEDGGRTTATASLRDIAAFREHRRWLGTDLLCGRVKGDHPLHSYLLENGIRDQELQWLAENPCPPDVLGLNYYLTSDRFLDDRLERYPAVLAGGDLGDDRYIDIEALRACPEGVAGAGAILMDAWKRYGIPVAITECHLGDSPRNQVRWLSEVWRGALEARDAGADVVAVTAWALLGSFNWPCLCTHDQGTYEPGAFTISKRNGARIRTPLAAVLQDLAGGREPSPAEWNEVGWWRLQDRLIFSEVPHPDHRKGSPVSNPAEVCV